MKLIALFAMWALSMVVLGLIMKMSWTLFQAGWGVF